jgi:amylosucrase
MEPSKVVPYFGTVEKPECHMLYNVTTMASLWHTVATADVRLLRHQLGTVFALPKQYTFLNYLRCHDDIGWGLDYPYLRQFGMEEVAHKKYLNDWFRGSYGSSARGELYNDDPRLGDARLCGTTASLCGMEVNLEQALKLDEMLHALLLSQSGIPVLYSGDEIGQKNDYTYHNDPLKAADSRYLHRGNLDWAAAGKRKNPDTVEGKIFNAIETLRKTRARNPAFHAQADVWVMDPHNDHVLAIGRYHGGQALVALFNFSSESQYVTIREEGSFADLLTGEKVNIQSLMLPGYSFRWITEE